jgi:hypothetical protein
MNERKSSNGANNIGEYANLINIARHVLFTAMAFILAYIKGGPLIEALLKGNVNIITILTFILFCCTIILGLLWLFSSEHEFSILRKYVGEFIPKRSLSPVILAYIFPLFIILMAAFSDNIIVYSALLWIYISLDIFAARLRKNTLITAIEKKHKIITNYINVDNDIYNLYVKRPFDIRGYFMGTITIAALFCGIIAGYFPIRTDLLRQLKIIGYILLISNLVISEIVVWIWRYNFYNSIRKHELSQIMP